MASKNRAHCACGFEKMIQVGGTRLSFQNFSTFPHFCKSCGLVEANVAKNPVCCPDCKSQNIPAMAQRHLQITFNLELPPSSIFYTGLNTKATYAHSAMSSR